MSVKCLLGIGQYVGRFVCQLSVDQAMTTMLTDTVSSDIGCLLAECQTGLSQLVDQVLTKYWSIYCSIVSTLPHINTIPFFCEHENNQLGQIGHFRFINILAQLRGFWVKIVNFSCFFCSSIPKRDWDTKKTTPNIEV